MTFFNEKQVEEYKAGWAETHPNEDDALDDADVVSILQEEERGRMIELLVKDDKARIEREAIEMGGCKGSPIVPLIDFLLLDGFTGYSNESDINLRDEIVARGLQEQVWGDWYEY